MKLAGKLILTIVILAMTGTLIPSSLGGIRAWWQHFPSREIAYRMPSWEAARDFAAYIASIALLIRLRVKVWGERRPRGIRSPLRLAVASLLLAATLGLSWISSTPEVGTGWSWRSADDPLGSTRLVFKRRLLIVERTATVPAPVGEWIFPARKSQWGVLETVYVMGAIPVCDARGNPTGKPPIGVGTWTLFLPATPFIVLFSIYPVLLLVRGAWFDWRRWRRWHRWWVLRGGGGLFCRKCRYNLTGNVSGRCPECGAPLSRASAEEVRAAGPGSGTE